jgi:hypothetical protein
MAGLVAASIQRGTSRADLRGAWIGPGGAVAEGPVLDLLVRRGGWTPVRPATPLERLLGQAGDEP